MKTSRLFLVFLVPIAGVILFGCGGGERYVSTTDFTPPQEVARASLVTALTAWKNGLPPGRLEGTDPPVDVFDSDWRKGQKLDSFEVVSEDLAAGAKRFNVRLRLKTPAANRDVNYYVVGRHPIGVYSEEVYRRILNMENDPKKTARR